MRTARSYHEAEMYACSRLLFRCGRYQGGWRFFSEKLIAPEQSIYIAYSYGEHFPCAIAFFVTPMRYDSSALTTFFNTDRRSRTTTKHMSIVRRAFGGGRSDQTVLASAEVMQDLIDAVRGSNNLDGSRLEDVRREFIGRAGIARKQNELDEYNAGVNRAIRRALNAQPTGMRHSFVRADMADANYRLLRTLPTGD